MIAAILRSVPRLLRHPWCASFLLGLVTMSAIYGLREAGTLQRLELLAYDYFVVARGRAIAPDPRIVLIGATEDDIGRWHWPVGDETLATLLERVLAMQPRAVGIDIYRDVPHPPGHERLAAVLRSNPKVIAVWKVGEGPEKGVAPPAVLAGTPRIGFSDVPMDTGGITRRALLFMDDGKTAYSSFALQLALKYLEPLKITPQPGEPEPSHFRLGARTIPPFEADDGGYVGADAGGYQFLLDFAGGPSPFASFSFTRVLEGELPAGAIRDKVVIIGVTAPSVKDYFDTPYSHDLEDQPLVYGITFHGHVVSQLLRMALDKSPVTKTWSGIQETAWFAAWCMLGSVLGLRVRGPLRFLLAVAAGLIPLLGIGYVAFLRGWWIPVVPPALGWSAALAIIAAYMTKQESAQKAELMGLFSRYVSGPVAENIWKSRDEFLDGRRPKSQRLTATVLFSDIRGFTTVSEKLDPPALMHWLNQYMESMTTLVLAHGGIVDKFIGDAVMAVFGIPVPHESESAMAEDASNAVRCALAMRKELERMNPIWVKEGLPEINIRVGIFTGPLVAGSLGSSHRLEYTVIGDTVNVASRLEGYPGGADGEDNRCRILIGEATRKHVEGLFDLRRVGEVKLKGKSETIMVYSVLGLSDSSAAKQLMERVA